jgi:hypothetical protein
MSTFTQKTINGKPNPTYVDLLDEDAPVAGQKFSCISFISPEKVIKQRELFYFERFLKQWEYAKSMEKFVAFLNFTSHKYHVDFDKLTEDFKEFVAEEQDMLHSYCVNDDYRTFVDQCEDKLTEEFSKNHAFTTNVRGLKIRGSFPTLEEAELRCKILRSNDPAHDVYVGPVGVWMPWDPEAYKTGRVEYMEEELNQLMSEKHKNEANAKSEFDKRVKETKAQAISENIKKAELSKNSLTQTLDESGNLVNITNMNTQERELNASGDPISTREIEQLLFEGDVVLPSKSKPEK